MTIERIRQTGAELGNLTEIDGKYTYGSGTFAASTDYAYTDTYSYKCDVGSLYYTYGYLNFTSISQVRIGLWMRLQSMISTSFPIIKVMSGGADLAELYCNNASSTLYVNNTSRDTGGSYYQAWHHVGFDIKTGSPGWVYVYRDGILDMTWDGTVTGNSTQLRIGKYGSNFYQLVYFDDIYIDSAVGEASPASLPMLKFYYVSPNGNGNYSQWTGSDGNSVDNYQLVDEIPPSTSDFVESKATDEYDSYAMDSITLADGELVRAVIPTAEIKRNGTSEEIALGTRYSSTDSVGSDQVPGAAYDWYFERQTTKPGGGDWEQTSLDGMELLLKSRGTY